MKKFLWFLPFVVLLYACPYESAVPLEPAPVEAIDTTLTGYWYGIVKDGSDFFGIEALEITKRSDSVYNITRYGKAIKGDMILPDTAYYTGYTSYVGDQRYMSVEGSIVTVTPRKKKPAEIKTQQVFYLAAFTMQADTLSVKTVTDGVAGLRILRQPAELKQLITDLTANKKNIFDNEYSLSYRKIKKPAKFY